MDERGADQGGHRTVAQQLPQGAAGRTAEGQVQKAQELVIEAWDYYGEVVKWAVGNRNLY